MSHNLYFTDKSGTACIDFPYQTSTKVSYAVMQATSLEQKLKILKSDLALNDFKDYLLERCETMLKDNNLILCLG